MSEMVERVAMAIANADDGTMVDPKLGWDQCDASMREDYRKEARAAIEALATPSDEMINAGIRAGVDMGFGVGYDDYAEIYKAMIDEAMKP